MVSQSRNEIGKLELIFFHVDLEFLVSSFLRSDDFCCRRRRVVDNPSI